MKKFIAVLALASIIPAFAEEYKFDTPEAWQSHWQFKKEGASLIAEGQKWMIGKKLIKLPEGTTIDSLKVSGTFRAVEGTPADTMYIGFKAYDKNRNEMQFANVHTIDGTFTTLAADAKKGENFIIVADAAKWMKNQVLVINAKADMSDLPNYNTLANVKTIEKCAEGWKLTLNKPLKADIAKGTAVRQHRAGGYMYYAFYSTRPGVSGMVKNNSLKKLWPHIAFVRFLVLANWKGNKEAKLELIDPKVTVLDPASK